MEPKFGMVQKPKAPDYVSGIESVVSEFVSRMKLAQEKEAEWKRVDPENRAMRFSSMMSVETTLAFKNLGKATAEALLKFPIPEDFSKKITDYQTYSEMMNDLVLDSEVKMEDLDYIFDQFDIPVDFVDRVFYLALRIEEEARRVTHDTVHDITVQVGDPVIATGNKYDDNLNMLHRKLLGAYLHYFHLVNNKNDERNQTTFYKEVDNAVSSAARDVTWRLIN